MCYVDDVAWTASTLNFWGKTLFWDGLNDSEQWTMNKSTINDLSSQKQVKTSKWVCKQYLDIVTNELAREKIVVAKHQYKVFVFYSPSLKYGT